VAAVSLNRLRGSTAAIAAARVDAGGDYDNIRPHGFALPQRIRGPRPRRSGTRRIAEDFTETCRAL